jgi:hypothetical protein
LEIQPGTDRANFSLWKNLRDRVAQRSNQNSVIHCIAIPPRQGDTRYISTLELVMPHLTLQEVIDRINQNYPSARELRNAGERGRDRTPEQAHRPEFYVPRLTRRLVSLMFGAYSS